MEITTKEELLSLINCNIDNVTHEYCDSIKFKVSDSLSIEIGYEIMYITIKKPVFFGLFKIKKDIFNKIWNIILFNSYKEVTRFPIIEEEFKTVKEDIIKFRAEKTREKLDEALKNCK